jgi:hypothetical protein
MSLESEIKSLMDKGVVLSEIAPLVIRGWIEGLGVKYNPNSPLTKAVSAYFQKGEIIYFHRYEIPNEECRMGLWGPSRYVSGWRVTDKAIKTQVFESGDLENTAERNY